MSTAGCMCYGANTPDLRNHCACQSAPQPDPGSDRPLDKVAPKPRPTLPTR
jgi:hypothetical protein